MTAADLTTEQRAIVLRVLTKLREELLLEVPCRCEGGFKERGLIAPDCCRHDIEDVMGEWISQHSQQGA